MPKIKGDYNQISKEMGDLYNKSELSLDDIGKRYNVSREAVRLRLVELGVEIRPKSSRHKRSFTNTLSRYTSDEKQIFYDLYHVFGMSFNQISFYTGINPKIIHSILNKNPLHVSRKNPPHKNKYENIITGYTKLGFSIAELAAKFEKPVSEILEILGDEIPGEEINIKSLSNSTQTCH